MTTADYFEGFSPEQRASLLRVFEIQEENFRRIDRRAKERVLKAAILLGHRLSELQARLHVLQAVLVAKKVLSSAELEAFRKTAEAAAQIELALNPEFLARIQKDQQELDTWAETRVRKLMEPPPTT